MKSNERRVTNVTNRRLSRTRVRACVSITVALVVAFCLLLPPTVRADSGNGWGNGLPTYEGALIADQGQLLAFVGLQSWGGVYVSVTNGSQVFGNVLIVVLYDLRDYTVNVNLALTSSGGTYNQTATVVPNSATVAYVNLPNSLDWINVELTIGGTPQFYQVSTPISFLPNSITNVGGLDILALAVVSEMLVATMGMLMLARYVQKKTLYARSFSSLIWWHVILLGILSAAILDYEWVDRTFAGWSPLIYVFPVSIFAFFSFLSLFNTAPPSLLLRANAPSAGRLSFHAWVLRIGRAPDGRRVLINPSWGGWLARLCGHYTPVTPQEDTLVAVEPFEADVINRRIRSKREWLKRIRRPSSSKRGPMDDFDVIPASLTGRPLREDRTFDKLYYTLSGHPVSVDFPRLTIHRRVEIPARYNDEGLLIEPEHTKVKFAWPHYEPTEGKAELNLSPLHFRSQQSVVNFWRSSEDLARVLSDTSLAFETLKAGFEVEVSRQVTERLVAREAVLLRISHDLSTEEASQEAERPKDVLPSLEAMLGVQRTVSKDAEADEQKKLKNRGKSDRE